VQTYTTTIRSWRGLAFAGVILIGTCYVLFQDLLEGAPLTVGHVLTALALAIATAAGHQIVPTFKAGRYPLTASMAILAAGAIVYIGLMSGARNGEQIAGKAERIEQANAQRVEILAERKKAQAMLDQARADIGRECASGEGTRCKGRRTTEAVYAAAVAGHDAKLAALPPMQTANGQYKALAQGVVRLPWFRDRKVADVEQDLIILLPWLAVLLAELSVPAFLSLALGHMHLPTVADQAQTSFPSPGGPGGPGKRRRRRQLPAPETVRQLPANVVSLANKRNDIVAALQAIGGPATVSELARWMNVTRGEASRRWREAGNLVEARRDGKFVVVTLRNFRAARRRPARR
jgi:hypothetical protein